MDLSRRNGIIPFHADCTGQIVRRRPLNRLSLGCEVLDNRQLLSTVAAAAPEFVVPPAASVKLAASYLVDHAPGAFAQFQSDLTRAVQQSDLNQADVSALAQDEAVVVQDIESAGLSKGASASDLRYVQDAVDFALSGSPGIHDGQRFIPLPQVPQWLDGELSNVPAFHQAEPSAAVAPNVPPAVLASNPGIVPLQQLVDQAIVVAREAKPSPSIQSALNHSYNRLSDALGRNAITDLGPGQVKRDALVVYYDGQVNRFVK
jgi:hypothetical protein